MSCSSCTGRIASNPCNPCKRNSDCEQRVTIDWVPNTACTVGVTFDGITDTLELREGIQNCETKTHMTFNTTTGCIEYQNELYVASDGKEGYLEVICASEIAKYINLEDLANVENEQPEACALLVYKADSDCGTGCQGIHDSWVHWYAKENLHNGLHYVAGFNEGGCLEALDVPTKTNEYWWAMWRPNETGTGVEFGYIQPEKVETLPTNEKGQTLVISQDENGKPIIGPAMASLCGRTESWVTRGYDGQSTWWHDLTQGTTDEIYITPSGQSGWRAPCCGIMFVSYCINVCNTKGWFEVDVTNASSFDPGWTQAKENANSTHSTWFGETGTGKGVSESCTAFRKLAKGETMILYPHVFADGDLDHQVDFHGGAKGYRCHSIKAVFIPLENA